MSSSFYKPEETIYHNDGRELALLEFIHSHPQYGEMRGNPEKILSAIDEYGRENAFLMNVGQEKGKIVSNLIYERKPGFMIELGGYVGYSAILFGDTVKKSGGRKYVSLERSSLFAEVSTELIKLAGLDDVVEVMVGPCRNSLRRLVEIFPGQDPDMIFIDHTKTAYANDLRLCEELGLVAPGTTTVVADNVVSQKIVEYQNYVRASPSEKKKEAKDRQSSGSKDEVSMGNPRLVYETFNVQGREPSGEPDGVDISHCVGIE